MNYFLTFFVKKKKSEKEAIHELFSDLFHKEKRQKKKV